MKSKRSRSINEPEGKKDIDGLLVSQSNVLEEEREPIQVKSFDISSRVLEVHKLEKIEQVSERRRDNRFNDIQKQIKKRHKSEKHR